MSGDMGFEHVTLSERADLPHSLMRVLLLPMPLLLLLLLLMKSAAAAVASAAVYRLGLRGVSSQASEMTEY